MESEIKKFSIKGNTAEALVYLESQYERGYYVYLLLDEVRLFLFWRFNFKFFRINSCRVFSEFTVSTNVSLTSAKMNNPNIKVLI